MEIIKVLQKELKEKIKESSNQNNEELEKHILDLIKKMSNEYKKNNFKLNMIYNNIYD